MSEVAVILVADDQDNSAVFTSGQGLVAHANNGALGLDAKGLTTRDMLAAFTLPAIVPRGAVATSASVRMESYRAQDGGDGTPDIYELPPDGIWDLADGPAAQWRGGLNGDVYAQMRGDIVGGASGFPVYEGTLSGNHPNFRQGHFAPESGHAEGDSERIGFVFGLSAVGADVQLTRVDFTDTGHRGSYPGALTWVEIWSTEAGGGGQLDRKPLALLATSATVDYDSVTGLIQYDTFDASPVLDYTALYAIVFRSDAPVDGVSGCHLKFTTTIGGEHETSAQPGMALAWGRSRGITPGNFLDPGNLPGGSGTPVPWTIPTMSGAGIKVTTPDLAAIVNVAMSRSGFWDNRRLAFRFDGTTYAAGGDFSYLYLKGQPTGPVYLVPELTLVYDLPDAVCYDIGVDEALVVDAQGDAPLVVEAAVDASLVIDAGTDAVLVIDTEVDEQLVVDAATEAC